MSENPILSPTQSPLVLDPTARRRAEEERRLHKEGGPVLVDILGERAWAVGDPDLLAGLLKDPRLSKDPRQHWPRFIAGEIVGKWPLYLQVSVDNMFTAYGDAHRRLRRLVSPAFTPRRLNALLPSVERNAEMLLDELADGTESSIDLRAAYAVQLPVRVISDLIGVPGPMRSNFKETVDRIWNTTLSPEEATAVVAHVYEMLTDLIDLKRSSPADDMTSALISARDDEEGGGVLSERELIDTLLLVIAAGYQTTVNLIDQAITALLVNPDQLAHVREGQATWGDVVEETLRFAAPVSHMPMRYAVEDIPLPDGTLISKGEPILPSFGAASNNPKHQGPTAAQFDVTRANKPHMAFGHGAHICLGAPLARAQGTVALKALFDRFPAGRLAVPATDLEPVPSILGNGHVALPVHLRPE